MTDMFVVVVAYTVGKKTSADLLQYDLSIRSYRVAARFDDINLARRAANMLNQYGLTNG